MELIDFHCDAVPQGVYIWPMHLHHFCQLDVLLSGRMTVRIEGELPFEAQPGDGWLIPPLVRHGFEQNAACHPVSFKFQFVGSRHVKPMTRCRISRLPSYIQEMIGSARRGPSDLERMTAIATLCALELLERSDAQDERSIGVESLRCSLGPVLENIEQSHGVGWSVMKMASACHLSADHFSRCFHRLLGKTPMHYLSEVRMRAAASMLEHDRHRSVKAIAEATGYATVHAFSSAFKRAFNQSPAAYRKNLIQV